MKNKKGKPELRFKDESGNNYSDWEEKTIGELLTFFSTNSFSRSLLNYESGAVKNIHYGDIHTKFSVNFDILKEKVPFVNEDVDISKIPDENFCKEGDLVIADASEDYKDIGKAIEIKNLAGQKVLAGLHTYIARDLNDATVPGFKGYLMQTEYLRLQMMKMATGISVLGITKTNLAKIKIKLPSKEEQQKIASFLSTIDEKISIIEKELEELKAYKKGVMQALFTIDAMATERRLKIWDKQGTKKYSFLRFRDDEGNDYPDWEKKKLRDVGLFFGGGTPSTKNSDFWSGNIPWISSSDLTDESIFQIITTRFITEEAISQSATKKIPPKSILIVSRVGVGKIAVSEIEICTSQDFTNLVPHSGNYLFLAYLIKLKTNRLLEFNQGTSIKGFVKSDLEDLQVSIPCLEEQTNIANFLTAIDDKINLEIEQQQQTQQFKKGLLQQMFN